MTTADDDDDDDDGEGVDDMALMKKRYEKQLANEATIMVATPLLAVHTEEPPTSPKSPSHESRRLPSCPQQHRTECRQFRTLST